MTPSASVIGADGWLGAMAAARLKADRIVFGKNAPGVPFSAWLAKPGEASLIINASGWRVRPGLTRADYFSSHCDTTRQIVDRLSPDQTIIHFSSASVMGANRRAADGVHPSPRTFPAADYAEAKLQAERIVLEAAKIRGFRAIVLRPAIVYSPGGEGMIATLLRLAQRGLLLKIAPSKAINHLCSDALLLDTLVHLATDSERFNGRTLKVADPFVQTNAEILAEVRALFPKAKLTAILPASLLSWGLRLFPRLRGFDLKTWGEILGVWILNSEYDASWLWEELMLDPEIYAKQHRWRGTLLAGRPSKS